VSSHDPEPSPGTRWPGDERGTGIGSAADSAEAVRGLAEAMADPGWLTEDPIAHLAPKLRAWLATLTAAPWQDVDLDETDGVLIIRARWVRAGRMRDLRADAIALLGSCAEDEAYIAQASGPDGVSFTLATGQRTGQRTTGHRAHGHIVRLEVLEVQDAGSTDIHHEQGRSAAAEERPKAGRQ
jgi:hypothetical protein